jgi:hypothetical protein
MLSEMASLIKQGRIRSISVFVSYRLYFVGAFRGHVSLLFLGFGLPHQGCGSDKEQE